MKTLLLTDIPPSHSYTAGLVTAQMCRAVDPSELVAFVIINRDLQPEPAADLNALPISFALKPNEQSITSIGGRHFGEVASFIHESRNRYSHTPELIEAAVKFGRKHSIDQVWAILQGQTMVRVSRRVASQLNVPLKTQIWDPLSWWHQARGVDRINRFLDNVEWRKTLRSSKIIASASPAMSEHLTRTYGTRSIPIIAAVEEKDSFGPASEFVHNDKFVIGMAGQFYAAESWIALCDALNDCGWRIAGRQVLLRIMGPASPPNAIPPENFEHLGWLEQSDVIKILAESCDICYCPYPFATNMEEVSRLSFPSKLVIYLASGRPTLFHGPSYSSPIAYMTANNIGLCSESLDRPSITAILEQFIDIDLYRRLSSSVRQSFLRDFTAEKQSALVREFLGANENEHLAVGRRSVSRYKKLRSSEQRRHQLLAEAFDPWFYLENFKHVLAPGQDLLYHYLKHGWKELKDPNHWFSVRYYLETNDDVRKRKIEPLAHYLEYGWREGRQPNPWFKPSYYLDRYHDVRDAEKEPFQHYLRYGQHEGRNPTPWFSTSYYTNACKDQASSRLDPLTHYCKYGWRDAISPSPWFSSSWYLSQYPDARHQGLEPWLHYALYGSNQDADPTPWFSTAFYKSNNLDIPQDGAEPFAHYLSVGWRQGRDPNSFFSTRYYLSNFPHIFDDNFEPCSHYFAVGWMQGLDPNNWFSTRFYLDSNPDVASRGLEPFSHYLTEGWLAGRNPNAWFSTRFYLEANPDLIHIGREPVTHYLTEGIALGKLPKPPEVDYRTRCTSLAELILIDSIKAIQADMRDGMQGPIEINNMHFELMNALSATIYNWLAALPTEDREK